MTGIIKIYRTNRNFGYGFVRSGTSDYYFTKRDWKESSQPTEGAEVTFDPVKTEKGLRAKQIRRSEHGK